MSLVNRCSLSTFLISCLAATLSLAQDTLSYSVSQKYDLLKAEENTIQNSTTLSSFYESLYQLKKKDNRKINIIHLGDSHIQADFLSGTVRENLQREFGNAGRGLIVPGRVARTNEPASIRSTSPSTWEVKRCVYPDQPLPIGIGGITIRSKQPNALLSLRTFNSDGLDYGFNKLTLFFLKDFTSYNFIVRDSLKKDLAFIGPFTLEQTNTSTVLLPLTLNEITLQAIQSLPDQTQATVFGLNLENGKPGIIYHTIGVNGAKFKHYTAASPSEHLNHRAIIPIPQTHPLRLQQQLQMHRRQRQPSPSLRPRRQYQLHILPMLRQPGLRLKLPAQHLLPLRCCIF